MQRRDNCSDCTNTIIGAVVGSVGGALVAGVLVFLWCRHRYRRPRDSDAAGDAELDKMDRKGALGRQEGGAAGVTLFANVISTPNASRLELSIPSARLSSSIAAALASGSTTSVATVPVPTHHAQMDPSVPPHHIAPLADDGPRYSLSEGSRSCPVLSRTPRVHIPRYIPSNNSPSLQQVSVANQSLATLSRLDSGPDGHRFSGLTATDTRPSIQLTNNGSGELLALQEGEVSDETTPTTPTPTSLLPPPPPAQLYSTFGPATLPGPADSQASRRLDLGRVFDVPPERRSPQDGRD